jgi:hypothetical protein
LKHFCTYFDSHYALRGLTLFRSMQEHCGDFVLHILCCDEATYELIIGLKQPDLRAIKLDEVESFEPRLKKVKPERTRAEYLWTLSPIWPLYLLESNPEIDLITYLDSDLFFFSSDVPIWEEFADASILIIEHRFPEETKHMVEFGRFNVGMMAFRRDNNGYECLNWYKERCLEWCYARCEEDRYGDQKYLDYFPELFGGVHILQHHGANVAPWNWMNGPLKFMKGEFSILGQPLIFYHFQGLKILNSWFYDPAMYDDGYGQMPFELLKQLHSPYIVAMMKTARWVRSKRLPISWGHTAMENYGRRRYLHKMRTCRLFFQRGMK